MMPMRRSVAAAAMAGSLLVGGATGAYLFGPSLAGAQTTTTTPGANGSTFKSNEDPTHEGKETPEQEAAEDSGQFRGHGGPGHGSNEDPAHEANETPDQEAAENARAAAGPGTPGTSTAPPSAPSGATGSGAKLSFRR
jgi:hypothetical protein